MKKEVVSTESAPKAIGPYSQAIKAGDFVFCSGQIALDAQSGQVISGGVEEQTKKVLENLKAVLEKAGATLENVVKTTVFLKDMNDFVKMNSVYAQYFTSNPPARAAVEAARLPKDVLVEIEAVAFLGGDK